MTFYVCRRHGADRKGGEGLSTAFHLRDLIPNVRRQAAEGRAA